MPDRCVACGVRRFLCVNFRYDDTTGVTRRYLYDSLRLSCDSAEYTSVLRTAIVMVGLWPVGVPLFYALLLWRCRSTILKGSRQTHLSRAATFLFADYNRNAFWWEGDLLPLEHCVSCESCCGVVLRRWC